MRGIPPRRKCGNFFMPGTDDLERFRRSLPPEAAPDGRALQALGEYARLVEAWNRRLNLSGARDMAGILGLAADSFHLAAFLRTLPLPASPLAWDMGAGAGLPGLPLRMVWDAGEYLLIEPRQKRALFMENCLARLGLPRTYVRNCRVEDMPVRPAPDLLLSRAFMPPEKLLPFCRARVSAGALLVVMARTPFAAWLADVQAGAGYALLGEAAYAAGGAERHFWALGADT